MTVSNELMLAILAMDSYNRGYDAGIGDGQNVVNGVDIDGLGGAGSTIGSAVVLNFSLPEGSQAAGFYAVAYQWNGETVISYRGTDSPWSEVPLVDLPIWSGDYDEPQLYLASQFYRLVAETATGPLTLTGHSLGGALAGFTAALYNQDAVIVDPIGFVEAFNHFRTDYANYGDMYLDLKSVPVEQRSDTDNDFILLYENTIGQFGFDSNNFAVPDSPNDNYEASHLEGSVATLVRDETISLPLALSVPLAGLIGSIDAHSAFLNVIIRFAQEMYASSSWVALADKLLPALFDDDIGKAIDAEHPTWFGSQIAYSALEEGTLVFGNTGIRAMFDDANELGAVVGAGTTTPLIDTSIPGLANIIVQFAGMMAKNKVDYGNVAGNAFHPENGIVSLIDANGIAVSNAASASYLTLDLNQDHWKTGNTDPEPGDVDIVGINTMLDELWLQENGNPDEFIVIPGQLTPAAENSILPILWSLYGHDQGLSDFSAGTLINSATFSLPGALSDVLLQHSAVPDEGRYVSLFSGTSDGEVITGSKSDESVFSGVADEIVFAGGGGDTVDGGIGSDVLIGGEGDDTLIGGHGDDVLIGGNDNDTIYDGEQWDAQGNVPDSNSIFLDESRDYISAGEGNDKVYSGKGTDIISLGDGADEVHLVQPEPDPNANPYMPDVATQAIIWGGDGIDKFYFSGNVHILSVTVQDMNESLMTGLSSEALFKACLTSAPVGQI